MMNHMESNESILVMSISMLIAGIFSGKITTWKDPAIKKLNPNLT